LKKERKMFKRKITIMLSLLLVMALSACNLPGGETTPTPDIALTLTAQAQLLETPTPLDTATPELTSTPEFTPTPTVPTVSVSVNTNCRTGPSTQYDLVGGVNVGQTAVLVGKSTSTGYWIINNLNGSGTCWLWGQYATVSGNTAGLPEYPTPPTPTPSPTPTLAPPAPVNNPTVTKACILVVPGLYNYTGTLNWEDKSDNEDGFNIYRNNALLTSVPANTTSYPIPPLPLAAGTPLKFGVESFNAAGKADIKEVTFTCP
jgi:hypothetical protein